MIHESVRVTRPGGHVIIGDVRDLRLLETFATSVATARSGGTANPSELSDAVDRMCTEEGELLIAPALFTELTAMLPAVAAARIELKRGWIDNELTKFRYDVVLYVGERGDVSTAGRSIRWSDCVTIHRAPERLLSEEKANLLVTDVPDARLSADISISSALRKAEEASSSIISPAQRPIDAVHPQLWREMGSRFRRQVVVTPAQSDQLGHYDVAIAQDEDPSIPGPWAITPATLAGDPNEIDAWHHYCSHPEEHKLRVELIQGVHSRGGRVSGCDRCG